MDGRTNCQFIVVEQGKRPPRSYLFTLRLWKEDLGNGETEWRGQVQDVTRGQVRYFRDWATLVAHLQALVPQADRS